MAFHDWTTSIIVEKRLENGWGCSSLVRLTIGKQSFRIFCYAANMVRTMGFYDGVFFTETPSLSSLSGESNLGPTFNLNRSWTPCQVSYRSPKALHCPEKYNEKKMDYRNSYFQNVLTEAITRLLIEFTIELWEGSSSGVFWKDVLIQF